MESQTQQTNNIEQPAPPKKGLSQKKIGLMVIGAIAIIMVAILLMATMMGPGDTSKVKIVVKSSGSWTGAYGEFGSLNTWSGSGDKTIVYARSSTSSDSYVVANAFSSNFGTITVQIVSMNGKVLAESTSTGFAQATWTA